MKILTILLAALAFATSGALVGKVAEAEGQQDLFLSAARTSNGEASQSQAGPIRRFVAFLEEKAGIPLPTVSHDKKAGNGYSPGSPMFNDQEAWVARNGDNVRVGTDDFVFSWVIPPWRDFWVNFYYHPIRSVFMMLLQILLWVLLAYLYIHFAAGWRRSRFLEQAQTQHFFLHSPWDVDCCSGTKQFDWEICLCTFCCPFIRWADTVGNPKMFPGAFWPAFLSMVILVWLAPLTLGFTLAVVTPLVGVYYRQQMRTKFGHAAGKPWTWVYDTLLWCCCPFCAIAQEAREVEKVEPGLGRKSAGYGTY